MELCEAKSSNFINFHLTANLSTFKKVFLHVWVPAPWIGAMCAIVLQLSWRWHSFFAKRSYYIKSHNFSDRGTSAQFCCNREGVDRFCANRERAILGKCLTLIGTKLNGSPSAKGKSDSYTCRNQGTLGLWALCALTLPLWAIWERVTLGTLSSPWKTFSAGLEQLRLEWSWMEGT